jgi:Ca2+-binding EF-hand superfamily protein
LKTILDKYDDADLNNVVIEASRLPEILSSLVDNWDENELQTLISAVDEDGKCVSVFP